MKTRDHHVSRKMLRYARYTLYRRTGTAFTRSTAVEPARLKFGVDVRLFAENEYSPVALDPGKDEDAGARGMICAERKELLTASISATASCG